MNSLIIPKNLNNFLNQILILYFVNLTNTVSIIIYFCIFFLNREQVNRVHGSHISTTRRVVWKPTMLIQVK